MTNILQKYKNYSIENIEHLKYSKFINDSASEFIATDSIESLATLIPKYLKKFKVIDKIIDEPIGGEQHDVQMVAESLKKTIVSKNKKIRNPPRDFHLHS